MNLVIIGKDTDRIALDIWKGNTNYTVINRTPSMWSTAFTNYIKKKDVVVSVSCDQFLLKPINDVIELFRKYEFIPIFISDSDKSNERDMYTALNQEFPSALLYTRNKKNKDYDKLLEITKGYLLGKGIILKDDKTLQTPRKRKRSTPKK